MERHDEPYPNVEGRRSQPGNGGEYAAYEDVKSRQSMGSLLRDLLDEGRLLLRKEIELARTETKEKITSASRGAMTAGIGAAVALAAILVLATAVNRGLTALLAQWMALDIAVWLAPLILTVILGAIAAAMISNGMRKIKQTSAVPRKTMDSMEDNARWLREKTTAK
jgi:hypothetical protein